MRKTNTFFASATWYEDDEVTVRSRHREPLRGRLCAGGGMSNEAANAVDHLNAKYKDEPVV